MKAVTIYTTEYCPYCVRAKHFLESLGVPFTEVNLEGKPAELQALKKRTGWRTVPQIFIGEEMVGGCTDIMDMHARGELMTRLAGS